MPRPAAPPLLLALGAAILALASCGGDDAKLLPGGTAREITANLDAIEQLADEGDCTGAESAALQVSEQVEALGGVDEKLKRALRDGTARLNEVVADCEEEADAVTPVMGATEAEKTGGLKAEAEKVEKEQEEAEREREEEEAEQEGNPALPPQANGEAKGLPEGEGEAGEEGEVPPSGGVGAGAPVGEGD